MAVSRREQALAAVEALLKTIPGVNHFRTPDFVLGYDNLPYVALYDGEDVVVATTSDFNDVTTTFTTELGIRPDDFGEQRSLGEALNELIAQVRFALGSSQNLGGTVQSLSWTGTTAPDIKDDPGAPQASCAVFYEIVRQETDASPYAPD